MSQARELLSQAAYARRRGVSRQYVSRLVKAGVLVMHNGQVDVVASDAVLNDQPVNVSETVPGAAVETGSPATSYAQAKLADMVFKAKLRRLDFETRSKKLIPADEVKVAWYKLTRQVRDKVLALPSKLAPQLAALDDTKAIRDLLEGEVTALLRGLQEEVRYQRN